MNPNPLLKKLGFSNNERVLIIHTDDIGMCQATLGAFAELYDFGLISSGSVMAPAGWFPAAAAFCRANQGVDMGVHLTLNCEWDSYRWAPLSTRDPHSGLMDDEGYLHRTTEAVIRYADPAAVQAEIEAQVLKAERAGIDVTHIDTHMGTVVDMKFIAGYVQLGLSRRLPLMLPRMDETSLLALGLDPQSAAGAAAMIVELEAMGVPLLDNLASLPLDQPQERLEQAKQVLGSLPAGLTHFIIHPAADTPELRAIAPDWPSRVADYQTFLSSELREYLRDCGVHIIGYCAIRDAIRAG